MAQKRYILFDFDGVIADSFAAAFGVARERCTHRTEKLYRQLFETNIYESDVLREDGDHSKCNHGLDWWGTFTSLFQEKDALFVGMDTVVRSLSKEYSLVIVSSSLHRIIASFLEAHGLTECFEGIYDADLHTSKREKIGMIFERFDLSPDDCVMITDSKGDILEAREKGVGSIAVTWGFNGREALESGKPAYILESPKEVHEAVTKYFALLGNRHA